MSRTFVRCKGTKSESRIPDAIKAHCMRQSRIESRCDSTSTQAEQVRMFFESIAVALILINSQLPSPRMEFVPQGSDRPAANEPLAARRASKPGQLPRRALVLGVPFISWAEMARTPYESWNTRNPSYVAAPRMLLAYWDQTLASNADFERATREIKTTKALQTTDELKVHIARGIPVLVIAALTPRAHPLYLPFEIMVEHGRVRLDRCARADGSAEGSPKVHQGRIKPAS
jgi:hypothetical protein